MKPRYKKILGPWYAASHDGHFQSPLSTLQAMQTSLRRETPITEELLTQIYKDKGEARDQTRTPIPTPHQEAKVFHSWQSIICMN